MQRSQKNLATKYDAVASDWRQRISAIGYPAAYRALVQKTLGNTDITGFLVLDAGTGCGDFSVALVDTLTSPNALDLLDISQSMLDQAQERLEGVVKNLGCYCTTLTEIPRSRHYDLVLCANVIEHCPDPMAALTALRQALKPGGQLLLVASKPHWCTAIVQMIWRNKSYRPAKLAKMLRNAGFSEIKLHPFETGPPSRVSFGYQAIN